MRRALDLAKPERAVATQSSAPAIEPGTSRILITVSGTVQLQ